MDLAALGLLLHELADPLAERIPVPLRVPRLAERVDDLEGEIQLPAAPARGALGDVREVLGLADLVGEEHGLEGDDLLEGPQADHVLLAAHHEPTDGHPAAP